MLVGVVVTLVAGSASALGLSLTPIGSATGQVGSTLTVGIDLTLDAGDYVEMAAPILVWDLEGGNVLDARTAQETAVSLGSYDLRPIVSTSWFIANPNDLSQVDRYDGTNSLADARTGGSLLSGFEQVGTVQGDANIQAHVGANGLASAGSYRLGTIEFLLQEVGTTQLQLLADLGAPYRSILTGANATTPSGGPAALRRLSTASGVSLDSLRIDVVPIPEPGTALLLGLGLAGLASGARRPARSGRGAGS